MAYDRFDRDEHSRWSDDRSGRGFRGDDDRSRDPRGGRDERGFWDRASDEVASWFGDDEAERRRNRDQARDEHGRGPREHGAFGRGWGGGSDRDHGRDFDRDRTSFSQSRDRPDRESNYDRGTFNRGGSSERDYNRNWERDFSATDRNFDRSRGGGYRPMTGDYGRGDHESEQFFAASGYGRGERGFGDSRHISSSSRNQDFDPHYSSWRDRHMSELDRDYDDFRREHQSKFENDFTSWREKRQHKRGLLGQIREHMEVVGSDDEHVGTVDKAAGDRIILTKSDPESGGSHHSLSCSDIDRIDGDKVVLDCKASEARDRWRDESRGRALFEREDQGEMGPGNLDRSFSGTYR